MSSYSSSLSSDEESDVQPLASTLNSNKQQYIYKSLYESNKIEKIIGINQSTFTESLQPIMFYVKYKDQSYQQCKWITKEGLIESQRGMYLYKKFLKNPTPFRPVPLFHQMMSSSLDNQPNNSLEDSTYQLFKPTNIGFDRGFITPEKIISIRENDDNIEYLVKWISLDITESTWETDVPKDLIEEFGENNANTHPKWYKYSIDKNKHKFKELLESPLFKNDHKLADYQLDALNWLQSCWFQNRNSILADEMGLGKTIESISILDLLSKMYLPWGPFIVICPLSTVQNWMDEFDQWTNFRIVNLIGNEKSREMTKENLIFQQSDDYEKRNAEQIIFDVLIVSFEMLSRELSFLKKFNFMYMIIDEAQRIKNSKSTTYQNCASIHSQHTLLMTGTPIQNDLSEIWSLLHFIAPKEFPDYTIFFNEFENKEDPETIERLQETLKPYIFRRKKTDVHLDIPEKEETIIEVEMTQVQRTFSQMIIKDHLDILSDLSSIKVNLNNIMMQLRKLFCHPFLIPELESICLSQYKDKHHIPYSTPLTYDDELNSLIYASGKTILIDKLLPKLKDGNHKVLIFSQMTTMLDILEDYLVYRHYNYERLDGSCTTQKRSLSIQRFQQNEDVFVFLLSTRAGGFGINLTQADTVIIYDSDWNPQNDIQAQARVHRFGQKKKVNVYRLITRGSYESEMFLRASKKLALDFAILDSAPSQQATSSNSPLMSNSSSLSQLEESGSEGNEAHLNTDDSKMNSRKELEMILKKGAYYTFKDDPNEIDKFCLENIDQILEHRAHTKKDLISGGNSRFSKVTFDGTTEQDDDFDRSDFWGNLVGANQPVDDDDGNVSYYGIKTRHKKKISYAPEKIRKEKKKKEKKDDGNQNKNEDSEEEEEEEQSSSSDNDIDFVPPNAPSSTTSESKNKQQQKNVQTTSNPTTPPILPQLQQPKQQNQQIQQLQQLQQLQMQQMQKQKQQSNTSKKGCIYINFPRTPQIISLSKFNIPLNLAIYKTAYNCLVKHGICGSRLFVSEFIQEICKTLLAIAYLRLPEEAQKKCSNYILEFIPNPKQQVLITPFKEIGNMNFINNFFEGKELIMVNCSYLADLKYKIILFLSNERLPKNFILAPEMSAPLGWSGIDDFTLLTAFLFENDGKDVLKDNKLPFSEVNNVVNLSYQWINDRISLILYEAKLFVPSYYKVTEYINSKKVFKKFNNINQFAKLNNNLLINNILTVSEQKKILRIFYIYGIPSIRGIPKIKALLRIPYIRDELIILFGIKVVIKAIKYQPNLCNLLKCFNSASYSTIESNQYVDIRWIKKEAMEAVALNLDILYRIRENYKLVNEIDLKLIGLPDWHDMSDKIPEWNYNYDKMLFKATAYYGFLFNSMLAKFLLPSKWDDQQIISWRDEEALKIMPIKKEMASMLFPIFDIEVKKKRLNQILDLVQAYIEKKE